MGDGENFTAAVAAQHATARLPRSAEAWFSSWPIDEWHRVCYLVAHTLRHEGGAAPAWQPWFALSAWGNLEAGDHHLARCLALMSAVYPDLERWLGGPRATSPRSDVQTFYAALDLPPAEERPAPNPLRSADLDDGYDLPLIEDCYRLLLAGLTELDWVPVQRAFDQLAEFACDSRSPGDWNAEFDPGYEPIPAALAAITRHRGFDLSVLSEQAQDWLWPAVESEPGIRPVLWPPPASTSSR